MTRNEILATVSKLLAEILDEDSVELTETTAAPDVPGWDSFANINLMVSIEQAVGVVFKAHEIEALRNVGDLLNSIEQKLAARK